MSYIGKNPKWNSSTFTPQSTEPSNPSEGMVYYDDGTNRAEGLWQYKDGQWQELGSSAAGINYIANDNAEGGTTDWNTYADAAGVAPVDGTGGVANITLTASTTSPLRGVSSFLLSKDAVNRQGEGVSTDFTIDSTDQAKMLEISFDHNVTANYADDDIRVYIYDVTNTNLIEVTPRDLKGADASLNSRYWGSFQTAVDSTSYRLIIHISSTNATAYDLKFDNVRVGPVSATNSSTIVSDWVDFTPTGSFTTNTTYFGKYRRVGDVLEATYNVEFSGAPGGGPTLNIDLPNGLQANEASMSQPSSDQVIIGEGKILDSGTARIPVVPMYDFNSNNLSIQYSHDYIGSAANANAYSTVSTTAPLSWGASDDLEFTIRIPILGWESGTKPNEVISGREISAKYYNTSAQVITNGSTDIIDFDTKGSDTTGAVTTGASWKFTVPESKTYNLSASIHGFYASGGLDEGDSLSLGVYINGALDSQLDSYEGPSSPATTVFAALSGSTILSLNKGDTVDFRINNNNATGTDSFTLASNQDRCHCSIYALNSLSSQIQPTETVACSYQDNSGQSLPDSTATTISFNTKVFDTHNSFNTGTDEYEFPIAGIYRVSTLIGPVNNSPVNGEQQRVAIRLVNSSGDNIVAETWSEYENTNANNETSLSISTLVNVVAGDSVYIEYIQFTGAGATTSTTAYRNLLNIEKIGN